METTTAASDVATALRGFATRKVKSEQIEYVAELLLATREENEALAAVALAPLLVESLEDVDWLDAASLQDVSVALARVLTGESEELDDEESEEALQARMLDKVQQEYAIDKSCLAVLAEDQDWHPARIRRHVVDPSTKREGLVIALQLEVEFIEFGKLQVVELEEVVLDDDVAEDDDEDVGPRRCEMCEREMRLTFHHVTPRVVHAKYLKMGYTREFLNRGIMICRPCHSKIHSTEDNKTLARDYNTLEKIMSHPEILRYVNYARKQRSSIRPEKKSKWPVGK